MRLTLVICALALVLLALVPAAAQPTVTPPPGIIETVAAFFATLTKTATPPAPTLAATTGLSSLVLDAPTVASTAQDFILGATARPVTETLTPTPSPTQTATPTATPTPSVTPLPSATPTRSGIGAFITATPAGANPSVPTTPPTPAPALAFATNTPGFNPAPFSGATPDLAPTDGWTCGDFPCADDLDGWQARIRVPEGYRLSPAGRFPGQVNQIAYGADGRLYATVLENGTRSGAVYVMEASGIPTRYSGTLIAPHGLAFDRVTGDLFVTARVTDSQGGGVWRIPAGGGEPLPIVTDLPCCYQAIDNQPAGITFGADGALYVGVGALTDRAEMPPRSSRAYAEILPGEAAIVRIDVAAGTWAVHADGIRYPVDLVSAPTGALFALDSGTVSGEAAGIGDRVLRIDAGGFYGWPNWTGRGCVDCPPPAGRGRPIPDLLTLPPGSLPRGLTVYSGRQFPANQIGSLFVALWNAVDGGQRIIRIDPNRVPPATTSGNSVLDEYVYEPFVTGLLRPSDVTVAPDGSLAIADYVYGQIWRVSYVGG